MRSIALTPSAAIAVVAAVLFACAPAQAQDKLVVGKAMPQAFSFVPLDVGMKVGIFAKHKLTIESVGMAGSAKLQQALVANSIDVGLGSGPELAFLVKGAPELAVAAMAGPPKLLSIIVPAASALKSEADLKGQKVSVSTNGSLTQWLVRRLADHQGWGPSGIETVALGADTSQLAALKTGQVAGMVTDIGTAFELESKGQVRVLYKFGDLVPDFIMHVIYVRKALADKDPDAVKRFLAGWFETIQYMRANRDETIKIAMEVSNVSAPVAARVYDDLMPMFSDDGKFSASALKTLSASFVQTGMLPKEPDLKDYVSESYLPAR